MVTKRQATNKPFKNMQPLKTKASEFTEGIYAHIIERNGYISICENSRDRSNEVWINRTEAKALLKWITDALNEPMKKEEKHHEPNGNTT